MENINEILNEWSYRVHDGIVDMNDPIKVAVLNEILEEYGIDEVGLKNSGGSVSYDDIIKNALHLKKEDNIPQAKGEYKLENKNINVNHEDLAVFKKLYGISPPKSKQGIETAGSKGSGNGEIAVYWLFKYQEKSVEVSDNRGGGNADLIIDGKNVEIKSYTGNKISIGRIGSYTESLKDLNIVLGVYALYKEFKSEGKKLTPPNSFHVSVEDLKQACKHTLELHKDQEAFKSINIPFIQSMHQQIETLITKLNNPKDENEFASSILKEFIFQKFSTKPGIPGYVINVLVAGKLELIYIDQVKFDNLSSEKILKTSLEQGTLVFPKNLFE